MHWLREDGALCRPGEVVAYCDLSVEPARFPGLAAQPFAGERTLQVALAPRVAGRLRIDPSSSAGGLLDTLGVYGWSAGDVIATLEASPADLAEAGLEAETFRLLMLAGRRMTWIVDVAAGLLPGWNSRARAWWADGDEPGPTLLCLGVCDASGIIRGDLSGFVEMFEATPFPAQMAHVNEHPLVPCAPYLLEQFLRTPAQYEAIAADITRALGQGAAVPAADDLVFAAALLTHLGQSPLRDSYEALTPTGLCRRGPAEAVLLSLAAESRSLLRHKTLGYSLLIYSHDRLAAGAAMRRWLESAFEPVRRSLRDIRDDYARLFDTIGAATGTRFLVLNEMSSSGREDISSYAPFDAPLGDVLANVAAKDANLMLHDLAETRDFHIVDVDAAAAELGGGAHVPDGIHQSAMLQARLRGDILDILARL